MITAFSFALKMLFILSYSRFEDVIVFFSLTAFEFPFALKMLFILSYSKFEAVIVLFSLTAFEFPFVKTFSLFLK